MAKLTPAQVAGLRAVDAGRGYEVNKRTRESLRSRFLIKWDGDPAVWQITPSGRTMLDEIERAAEYKRKGLERASRPVPASAFVEPSARTAPAMGLEYEDDEPEDGPMCREGDDVPHPIGAPECILTKLAETEQAAELPAVHRTEQEKVEADEPFTFAEQIKPAGISRKPWSEVKQAAGLPAVQLTPAPEHVEREATDAETLQLLAMLDHGVTVARGLYQEFGVVGAPACFSLDVEKLNRAARDAVRFGLARQTYSDRLYALEAEPIHLLTGDGQVTPCGRYPVAARNSGKRLRVTADPAKVTHDFCQK